MTPLLVLGALGLLLLAGSGSSRSSRSVNANACSGTPEEVRRKSVAHLISWAICTGRNAVDVAHLLALMRTDGRDADAARIEAAWNSRLELDDTPGDGTLDDPADDARAVAALGDPSMRAPMAEAPATRGTFSIGDIERVPNPGRPPGSPASYDEAEARRTATLVARSIRSGGGYRPMLRRFQAAAGIAVDGRYGPISRAALRWFGVDDPPAAIEDRGAPEQYQPYTWDA